MCEVLIVFCVERPSEEWAPLGWEMELCGCSSCVCSLMSLLNTVGFLLWQSFCRVMDLWYECDVLLILHNSVGCFVSVCYCEIFTFTIIDRFKTVFKLHVLWSVHQLFNQGWRRNSLILKTFPINSFSQCYINYLLLFAVNNLCEV